MNIWYIILVAVVLLAILLTIATTAGDRFLATYKRFDEYQTKQKVTSQQVLFYLAERMEMKKLKFARIHGYLTDCYVPRKRTIAISDSVYNNTSIAAVSVVAHEFGHAMQHDKKELGFIFSEVFGWIFRFFGKLIFPTLITGMIFLAFDSVTYAGMIMIYVSLGVLIAGILFKIVTIPIEYNASNKALKMLKFYEVMDEEELKIAKKVVRAAGFTYIADFLRTILFIDLIQNRRRRK